MPHLIVFSHLRWEFVFQRPQHLLSRLACHYPVVFVEEPVRSTGAARLERSHHPCPGVEVLRPHTAVDAPGFHDDQLSALQPLIASYLADHGIDDYLVWFYTPMALPLLADLAPRALVYDCMDELAAFKNAPRQMRQRETALLKSADLVLTGGPRLYEAKRASNPNVLCLPSAVDADHYATARATGDAAAMALAAGLQPHAGPRLGFFGVIDERLDIDLVARLADGDPAWQIVMVGPVVKIDPAALPRRANLHWLGQQSYAILPQLVAGWDVCLMPFALNESTEFISPTKTLEYMAAGKPVVSTPIHDVKAMFGDLVAIAATPESFIAACREALGESSSEKAAREAVSRARVAQHSWDAAVATIRMALDALPATTAAEHDAASPAGGATRAQSRADAGVPPQIAAIG